MDLSETFIQAKSLNGFGDAHITKLLDLKNPATYYHFPIKEELADAVIQRYRECFRLRINNSRIKDLLAAKTGMAAKVMDQLAGNG